MLAGDKAFGLVGEPRNRTRRPQLVGSRRLEFHGFDDIGDRNFPAALERRLSPKNVGLAQLGERGPFRLMYGRLELFSAEDRVQTTVVLASQIGIRASKVHHPVEAPRPFQDRRIEQVGSLAVATTTTPSCVATPSRQLSKVWKLTFRSRVRLPSVGKARSRSSKITSAGVCTEAFMNI